MSLIRFKVTGKELVLNVIKMALASFCDVLGLFDSDNDFGLLNRIK